MFSCWGYVSAWDCRKLAAEAIISGRRGDASAFGGGVCEWLWRDKGTRDLGHLARCSPRENAGRRPGAASVMQQGPEGEGTMAGDVLLERVPGAHEDAGDQRHANEGDGEDSEEGFKAGVHEVSQRAVDQVGDRPPESGYECDGCEGEEFKGDRAPVFHGPPFKGMPLAFRCIGITIPFSG